ncbi:MAG: hypothetical protein H6641_08475 [Caldilineaceae bacterium]|nr:hypothetical protein [Caldilineaceae bacterium]
MNRTVRAFVVTPLLFICMIIVPAVALSADGYLRVNMLQSPFAEPTPMGDAGEATAAQIPEPPTAGGADSGAGNTSENMSDEGVENDTESDNALQDKPIDNSPAGESAENNDVINDADPDAVPEADADAPGGASVADVQNDSPESEAQQSEPSQAAVEVSAGATMTDTNSGGTGALPSTQTPAGSNGTSPLPTPTFTPTEINTSPLPTPTFTPTNTKVPPTAAFTWTPTTISRPTTPASTFTPTAKPPMPPVVTVQPTTVVLPPTEPTATSAYPTPIREIPTATPQVPASALRLDGYWVQKVIGDRFSSVIYAFANGWLYRSSNDGATWALLTSMPVVDDFIMNADEPNILFSGNHNSCADGAPSGPMLKSTNGGLSWFELPDSNGLRPLITHPFKPEIIVAADCQWLYISEDGGNSWRPRPDLSEGALWHTYTIVSAAAVYTEDTENPDDLAWLRLYVGGQAADGSGIVAYTTDLGQSWQQITPDVHPAPWGMSTIALDPFNANYNWFADRNGVWYTPDGGMDWRFTYEGLNIDKPEGAGALLFMVMHPTGQIYLGTEHGLYTKVFDGLHWVKVADTAFDQARVNNILFTETNANLLYLNTSDGVQLVRIEG